MESQISGRLDAATRRALLAHQARWLASIGITEQGGQNRGQLVEFFQRAVDGKAIGEPWCAAFVWACIQYVDGIAAEVWGDRRPSDLVPSEWVLAMWEHAVASRSQIPRPGDLMVWQHWKDGQATQAGHIGIVTGQGDGVYLPTVEGNTSAGTGVVREGDGVFARMRKVAGEGDMKVLGFLQVWL